MERYLRIFGYDLNETVYDMAYQICKFQLDDANFLNYNPSQIAAAAVILAINIFQKNFKHEDNYDPTFFNDCTVNKDG